MSKVGVEVEYGGDRGSLIQQLQRTGLSSRSSQANYIGHSSSEWLVKFDASVVNGGELVSPPLEFEVPEQRGQITTAVKCLQAIGARPIPAAGIHVHVDVHDFNVKQLQALVKSFYKYEDLIYRIASSGHDRIRAGAANYAVPLRDDVVAKLVKARSREQFQEAWYGCAPDRVVSNASMHGHHSRYRGLNLHSYFYRGTVEYRVFNPSVNPDRIQTYVAMCVALVQDARNGKNRSINQRFTLGGMESGDTNPRNAFHRFQQVLRYEAGMSREDMSNLTKFWNDSKPQSAVAYRA